MLQLTTVLFLIAFTTLAVIHNIAVHLYLYWRLPLFDLPMHSFGGVIIALGLYTLRDLHVFPDKFLRPIPVVLIVLAVAIVWELFEFYTGISFDDGTYNYVLDSSSDILVGVIGGLIGYLIGNSIRSLH